MSETLAVYSVFSSLQGETTMAGRPCAFVRLAGCPLACSYCDTREACESAGREVSIPDLVEEARALGKALVAVTGGEPLAQGATPALLTALADDGLETVLETSGAFSIDGIDPRVRIVMDVKTPGSGMASRTRMENLERLVPGRDEIKMVTTSRSDFEWCERFVVERGLAGRHTVLFSPAGGSAVASADLAEWILESGLDVRLQIQLHKVLWPDAREER